MFKPKTPISGRLDNSSGEWIRTTDLRVMSPTSTKTFTPTATPTPQTYTMTLDYALKSGHD